MERLRWSDLTIWERIWTFLAILFVASLLLAALHRAGFPWRADDGARVVPPPARTG